MVRTSFCMLGVLLAVSCGADGPREPAKAGLSPEVEKTVRDAVYSGELCLAHPVEGKYELSEIVLVPAAIEKAYEEHPRTTMDLLVAIVERGRPRDSMLAASFVIALVDPRVASVVFSVFKEDTYDTVDVNWEVTPRRHWLGKLKEWVNKSKAKE